MKLRRRDYRLIARCPHLWHGMQCAFPLAHFGDHKIDPNDVGREDERRRKLKVRVPR